MTASNQVDGEVRPLLSQPVTETTSAPTGVRSRLARLWPDLAGVALSAGLALAAVTAVLRLWRASLNVPLSSSGDALLNLMVVNNMQTTGWYQNTPDLGAPFGQDLAAYPSSVGDLWHMVSLKVLSLFLSPAGTINVYFVLGFPVIAAVAYGCLRVLHVSRPFAVALGAAYAVLPYHFLRGENHLLLGAYYAVPVACVIAVALADGRLMLRARPRTMSRAGWAALAGAVLLAGTGLYYAAFAILLFVAAGTVGSLATRRWRSLLTGVTLSAIIGVGLVLAALPNLLYQGPPGSGAVVQGRSYSATEYFGLKITNLLLPLGNHRIPAFAHLRAAANDSLIPGEGSETLGVLGVVGLVAVILAILIPVLHRKSALADRLRPLGTLTVVALLVGTVAGINSMFAVFGFGQLRAWDRISVVIAFLSLAGLGHLLDAARLRWEIRIPGAHRLIAAGVAALVLMVGVYDQTSPAMIPNFPTTAKNWNADQAYFTQVSDLLGSGASVFNLPFAPFPENPPIVGMTDYDHVRGYLHSDLRWSYGGVKYQQSEWQPIALQQGIAAAVPRLIAAGFSGIYINRTGYADYGAEVESGITSVIGKQTPLVNVDGTLAVYDLRSYAATLKASGTVLPNADTVLYPVHIMCTAGCYDPETSATGVSQWAQATATLTMGNPAPQAARVTLRARIHTATPSATVIVRVGAEETQLTAVDGIVNMVVPAVAPPGSTTVQLITDSEAAPTTPNDARDLRQSLSGLEITTGDAAG